MTEERRRITRLPILLEAQWKSVSGDAHAACVRNLSMIGCFLETSEQLLTNEPIDVDIEMPEGENIVIRGKVVFNIPRGGIGVQFIEVNDQSRESLDRFIDHYARNEPEEPCNPTPQRTTNKGRNK